jgi:hypothetical protein
MEEQEKKKKRGYLSNFANYREWFLSHDPRWQKEHMCKCEHCGRKFIPNAPNQRFCGPDNNSCYAARNDATLGNGQWIKKMTANILTPYYEKNGS